jgi:hypothetical protein
MMLAYLLCGRTEMVFLTMFVSPYLVSPIELSLLIVRFKREYMSVSHKLIFFHFKGIIILFRVKCTMSP